jgi:hypothetical protein
MVAWNGWLRAEPVPFPTLTRCVMAYNILLMGAS